MINCNQYWHLKAQICQNLKEFGLRSFVIFVLEPLSKTHAIFSIDLFIFFDSNQVVFGQFHQHFTSAFAHQYSCVKKFSNLKCKHEKAPRKTFCTKRRLKKCWWNWHLNAHHVCKCFSPDWIKNWKCRPKKREVAISSWQF